MLKNQCKIWPDPIAAVVYVPTVRGRIAATRDRLLKGKELGSAVVRLEAFFGGMERHGGRRSALWSLHLQPEMQCRLFEKRSKALVAPPPQAEA
jgi:hypothetical protein